MPAATHRPPSAVASLGRRNSKGTAIRRGDLKISDPIQLPAEPSHAIRQPFTAKTPTKATTTPNLPLEGTWPRKSASPGLHSRTRSNGADELQKPHGRSSNSTSRTSAGPSMLNGYSPTSPSKGSLRKQKDGKFRSKLRRMFGSRRLRETTLSSEMGGHQAQTEPPNSIAEERPTNKQPTPTRSQPVGELARSSALTSRSPEPLDQVQASPQHWTTSHTTEDHVPCHRRRNTLPSVTLSFHEAQMLAETLGEVGMRPSTKPPLHHSDGEWSRNLKRRSRSADEFRDEARSHQMSPIQWRRRSGGIQYWRNSVLDVLEHPISEPSGMQQDAYGSIESDRSPFRNVAPSPSSAPRSASRDSLKQFHFGSFPNNGAYPATMEQRLTTLEVKSIDHELAIAELQGCRIPRPATATKVPKRMSVQDIFPGTNDVASPARPFWSSPADSPTPADHLDRYADYHRSSNALTIRPTAGHFSSSSLITPEQYEAVMALLATEQAARCKLEEIVTELQTQIDSLRNVAYLPRRPSAYPTPSPEPRHSPSTFRSQSTRRPLGFPRSRVSSDETSRFSVTDADESDAEDGFLDTFETPRETPESRFGYESNRVSPTAVLV